MWVVGIKYHHVYVYVNNKSLMSKVGFLLYLCVKCNLSPFVKANGRNLTEIELWGIWETVSGKEYHKKDVNIYGVTKNVGNYKAQKLQKGELLAKIWIGIANRKHLILNVQCVLRNIHFSWFLPRKSDSSFNSWVNPLTRVSCLKGQVFQDWGSFLHRFDLCLEYLATFISIN